MAKGKKQDDARHLWRIGMAPVAAVLLSVLADVQPASGGTPIALADGSMYESDLPVLYIDFDGRISDIKKKAYIDAHMKIAGNDTFGGTGSTLYDGAISIKGRGNTTWKRPKKPYKIKLDKKTNLFGFGKNKHWVLLANYLDESLMRNKVAYDLSHALGLAQMESTWVDVVMNGTYIGNYQLCEHIRVGASRIDIFDWDDVIDDSNERELAWLTDDHDRNITGGYIFELSDEYDEVSKFKTAAGLKVMVKTPEYLMTNKGMFSYVKSFWQSLENAWLSPDKLNEAGRSWTEYADIDSMVAYWLVQEIMGNIDAVYKSRYAYKDMDSPIVFGPVWDFDWSSGSAMVDDDPTGWKSTMGATTANFLKYWLTDAEFRAKAVVAYANLKEHLQHIVSPGGLLDSHYSYIVDSARRNEALWFFKRGFDGDFAAFRNFLSARISWLDGVLASETALEQSASALYQTTISATGPFAGNKKAEFVGRVLQGGKTIGTVTLQATKARKGYCGVSGKFADADGRRKTIGSKKIQTGTSPSLAILPVKVAGESNILAMRISDNAFLGMLGAYGVEGAKAEDRLPDGEYVFRMDAFPEEVGGYKISVEKLPLEATIAISGTKWTVDGTSEKGANSSLTLTGNKKAGVFSGKFKVYATKKKQKKTLTATISGVIINGQAHGVATLGRLGATSEVSIEK